MPTTLFARIRQQDTEVWRIATRSVPVAVQPVLAAWFGIGWLLGHLPVVGHIEVPILVAIAVVLTAIMSLLIGGALVRSDAPRRRGIGLAVAGSGLAALVGGLAYALVFLPIVSA